MVLNSLQSDERDILQAMSETNEKMAMLQIDLLTAVENLEVRIYNMMIDVSL